MSKRTIEIPVEPGDKVYTVVGDYVVEVKVESVHIHVIDDPEREAERVTIWGSYWWQDAFREDKRKRKKYEADLSLRDSIMVNRAYLTLEEAMEALDNEKRK